MAYVVVVVRVFVLFCGWLGLGFRRRWCWLTGGDGLVGGGRVGPPETDAQTPIPKPQPSTTHNHKPHPTRTYLPHVRVPPVLVHGQDADLDQVRPQQAPAGTTPAPAAGRYVAPDEEAGGFDLRVAEGHADPALGFVEFDEVDLHQVVAGGAGLDGDLLRRGLGSV